MPNDETSGLSIEDLSKTVGLSVRTIRYYIAEGLIDGPDGRGKAALYGDEHAARLRLIRRLSNERLPLAEIKKQLTGLTTDDVRALLREEESRSVEIQLAKWAPSPKDYIAALLRNARAAREEPTGSAPAYAEGPSPKLRRAVEESPAPFDTSSPVLEEPSDVLAAMAPPDRTAWPVRESSVSDASVASTWEHRELAPGIVLQIRDDARIPYRDLIGRLLREAGRRRPDQPP